MRWVSSCVRAARFCAIWACRIELESASRAARSCVCVTAVLQTSTPKEFKYIASLVDEIVIVMSIPWGGGRLCGLGHEGDVDVHLAGTVCPTSPSDASTGQHDRARGTRPARSHALRSAAQEGKVPQQRGERVVGHNSVSTEAEPAYPTHGAGAPDARR